MRPGPPGVTLRRAVEADLDWVNAQYATADFQVSNPSHAILIAERGGAPAGIGRLVPVAPGMVELGGVYVLDAHRGLGVARLLIEALLDAARGARVYCIPYTDLAGLYERCGFAPVEPAEAPESVRAKLEWCTLHYAQPVCLMVASGPDTRA